MTETDPHPRCPACGGLLEVRHRPPTLTPRRAARAGSPSGAASVRAPRPRASGASARSCCPPPSDVVSHPGRQHAAAPPRRARPLDRRRPPAAQARGPQPDRLVQGPGDDGRRDAGAPDRRDAPSRARRPATPRPRSPRTPRRRGSPRSCSCPRGQVALGKLAQSLAYGARTLLVRGRLRRLPPAGARRRATRLGVYLLNSINPFRIEGQKTIVLEMLQQLSLGAARLDRAPGRQPRQHRGVRESAARGATLGLIAADAAPRGGAGGGRGAVRPELRGGLRAAAPVKAETVATAIRIGDPASYDRAVRAIRETERRRARGDRRGDPRGEGRGRRLRRRVRAGERGERRGRAGAGAAGRDRLRRARRRGAHRAHPQGSRDPAPVPPGDRPAAAGRQPADRDRRRRSRRSSGC